MDDESHHTPRLDRTHGERTPKRLLRLLEDDVPIGIALCLVGLIALPVTAYGGGFTIAIGACVIAAERLKDIDPSRSRE